MLGEVDSVLIESSRFIGNLSAKRGAAIQIDSLVFGASLTFPSTSLTLRDNTFIDNRCGPNAQSTETNGGAVFISLDNVNGDVAIDSSDFVGNTASVETEGFRSSRGGGLYVQEVFGDVSIDRCRFKRNVADDAAAIFLRNADSVSLTRSKIERNDSLKSTSAVGYVLGFTRGSLVVRRSHFRRNNGTFVRTFYHEGS